MKPAFVIAAFTVLAASALSAQTCYEPLRPTVVQIAGMQVGPQGDNMICELRGQVIASFAGTLPVGETIRTTIPCSGPIEPGLGASYFVPEEVEAAAVMEIHFNASGMIAESDMGRKLAFLMDGPTTQARQIEVMCMIVTDADGNTTYVNPVTGEVVSLD
jgi:hypothetical protein